MEKTSQKEQSPTMNFIFCFLFDLDMRQSVCLISASLVLLHCLPRIHSPRMPSLGINHQRQRARILSRASHRFFVWWYCCFSYFYYFFHGIYAYVSMNPLWKSLSLSITSGIFSSSGRIVVRRWYVPSFWPKPVPGTVEMPVLSRSFRQ